MAAIAVASVVGLAVAPPDAAAQDGNQVWQVQRCLTALGYYAGPIDGITGAGSQNAVLRFQRAAGIAPTAALDSLTWVALQAAHELAGPPIHLAADGPAAMTVSEAQRILLSLGYDPGPIDGALGPATQQALSEFQQSNGLAADATLDEATMAALREHGAELNVADAGVNSGNLTRYAEVFEAQMLLAQLGYGDLVPDGQIGPSTANALAEFLRAEGLPGNGELTPETLARLRQSAPMEDACLALTKQDVGHWLTVLGYEVGAGNAALENFQRDMGLTDDGTLTPETYDALRQRVDDLVDVPRESLFVVEAQLRLAAAGYDVGPIDGLAGQQAETALRAFQQANGLPASGLVDHATLAALRGESGEPPAADTPVDTSLPSLDATFEISEDAAEGTHVGSVAPVESDPDLTFALIESATGRFAIDAQSGDITVADAAWLDYNRDQSHRLVVQVTDSAGMTQTGIVSIDVVPTPRPQATDTYEQAIRELNPVGYWRLDAEADGVLDSGGGYGDTAVDRVSRHPGTYNGGTDTDRDGPFAGISTGTTRFDGDDEFIQVPDAAGFMPADGTILLWFAADETAGERSLVHLGTGTVALDISVNDGRLRFAVGAEVVEMATPAVVVGQWHHIAASWGATGLRLYFDGALIGNHSDPVAIPAGTGDLFIAAADDGSRTFAGRISEVAVIDAPLSANQIGRLIDRGVNGKDIIIGTPDADTLTGTIGEVIFGKAGNDTITGSTGDDIVYAGTGNDSIDGGGGSDLIFGGDGSDTFLLAPTRGSLQVYGGTDLSEDMVRLLEIAQAPNTGDWTYALTDGAVADQGPNYLTLEQDSDGDIELVDGTRMHFQDIERIEW